MEQIRADPPHRPGNRGLNKDPIMVSLSSLSDRRKTIGFRFTPGGTDYTLAMFAFDLHIHSCLCHAAISTPRRAIAQAAKAAGLNGIMLADHNSSRNSPALAEACRRTELNCLFGMEITSAEEVHGLAVSTRWNRRRR